MRLENERCCILVIIGADEEGNKELLAVESGYRESSLSWKEVLLSLKERGLQEAPKLAIGDGALSFWKALDEVFPQTKRQRCWVHKTANILDKMPKSIQSKARSLIHEMYTGKSDDCPVFPTCRQAGHKGLSYKELDNEGADKPEAMEFIHGGHRTECPEGL